MNLHTLRACGCMACGFLQERLGRLAGREDWRLKGLMRQVRAHIQHTHGQQPPSSTWRRRPQP